MDNNGLAQNSKGDLVMAAGAEERVFDTQARVESDGVMPGVARERAQMMGWQVLEGGNNVVDGVTDGVRRTEGVVDFEAAQEIRHDQAELTHPEEFVGDETTVQMGERLANQQENSLNDIDPKRNSEAQIAARSQEKIAQAAMKEVEGLMGKKQVLPAEIMEIWRKQGDKVLNSFENPHPIGKGN